MESKFYSEGALGELNPTLKTVLDILKGISSVRGLAIKRRSWRMRLVPVLRVRNKQSLLLRKLPRLKVLLS